MPNEPFDQGVNTAMDRADLRPGEMRQAVGHCYKPGDAKRLHKLNGRSTFGDTGSGAKVKGVELLQYDSGGTDRLVALSGTTLYGAPSPAKTGTFASLKTGLSSNATSLSAAHYNDVQYLATGDDQIFAVESDGTVYTAGMAAPQEAPTGVVAGGVTATLRPGAATVFTNPGNVYDTDTATFGGLTRSTAGTSTGVIDGWAADTGTSRVLTVVWELAGIQNPDGSPINDTFDDAGGVIDAGWSVDVKIEVSEDAGVNYTTHLELKFQQSPIGKKSFQTTVTDTTVDLADVKVRVSLVYNYNRTVLPATLRVYDTKIDAGSATANFTLTTGIYYAFTEVDQTRLGGRESPPSKALFYGAADWIDKNRVDLTFPSTAINTATTHYRIYRTHDGGTNPNDLRELTMIAIGTPTFRDDFSTYSKDQVAGRLVPLLQLQTAEDPNATVPIPKHSPPKAMVNLRAYEGSLVGIDAENPRTIYYSLAGGPESWPHIYAVSSFPMEEHDELLDMAEIGGSLVLGAKGVMMRVDGLPRIVSGVFDQSKVERIRSAPGVVGKYAMTAFSLHGEPRVAWVSYYGVFVTNGYTVVEISHDIEWDDFEGFDKSSWVLTWDPKYQHLRMDYSSTAGGTNNRYMLIHMAPEHGKQNGAQKITPGHYGAANHLALGQVGNYRRMYSGHTSDGKVYLEDDESAGSDSSNAYNASGDLPTVVETRRMYADEDRASVLTAKLHHGDYSGDMTVTMTAGNDDDSREKTRTETVSATGQKADNFGVFLAGEWIEFKFEESGSKRGFLRHLAMRVRKMGYGGKIKVA